MNDMQFVATALSPLRENDRYSREIENFTYVSALTLQNDFPLFVHRETVFDPELGQGLAALMSYEPVPDQPADRDIDSTLKFERR